MTTERISADAPTTDRPTTSGPTTNGPPTDAGAPDDAARRRRPRDAARTREDILAAAGQLFSQRGYAHVTLKMIADEVGVTPALVVRYFGGKRALFEEFARSHEMVLPPLARGDLKAQLVSRARAVLDYFEDREACAGGLALLRSLDLDDGDLFNSEIDRRIIGPWSAEVTGADAELRVRMIAGLLLGVGLFSLGALTGPDRPPLDDAESERFVHYLSEMMAVCLDDA